MPTLLDVPGLARTSPAFRAGLYSLATLNGWNPDAIAAVISHESGFDPSARSSSSSAAGLLQIINATARALGTTSDAIAEMSAEEQLPIIEAFYSRFLGQAGIPLEDYLLVGYGRNDAIGQPDGYPLDCAESLDPAERRRYEVNAGLDAGGKGCITAGDVRASIRAVVAAAGGRRRDASALGRALPRPRLAGALALVGGLGVVVVLESLRRP
jgi:hypothetical protein